MRADQTAVNPADRGAKYSADSTALLSAQRAAHGCSLSTTNASAQRSADWAALRSAIQPAVYTTLIGSFFSTLNTAVGDPE
jgi:hypothetical protein